MKKLIAIMLTVCLLAALVGCKKVASDAETGGSAGAQSVEGAATDAEASGSDGSQITVITTVFAPYDFTKQIAGDLADVTLLLPPGSESHSFEPTPRDIITIQNCDIFVYVGGDSDAWVEEILSSIDTENIRIITLMDVVDTVEEEIVEGMQHNEDNHDDHDHDHDEHDHDEEQPEYDEHVWTSPMNAKIIAAALADAIIDANPENADLYSRNAEAYIAQLGELDAAFREVVENSARSTVVFGDRFPFRYFADAYGIDYFAAFPGCSTETEPSAATIAFLINKVNDEQIPVVFHAELSNQKIANAISEDTDAKVLLLHACHNVTRDEMKAGVTYLDLMNQNVENLREALS